MSKKVLLRNIKSTARRSYVDGAEKLFIDIDQDTLPAFVVNEVETILNLSLESVINKINELSSSMVEEQCIFTEHNLNNENETDNFVAYLGWCYELGYFVCVCNSIIDITNNDKVTDCYTYVVWNEKEVYPNIATINLSDYTKNIPSNPTSKKIEEPKKFFKVSVGSTVAKERTYSRLNISEEILNSVGYCVGDTLDIVSDPNTKTITIKKAE